MPALTPRPRNGVSRPLTVAVGAVLFLSACSGDTAGAEEFCESARAFVTFTQETPLEDFLSTLDDMVETAPNEELATDAQTLRDGLASAGEGDASGVESPEFQEAGDRIDDYASENCSAE